MKPNIQDYKEAINLGSANPANIPEKHLYAINGVIHVCDNEGYILESHDILTLINISNSRQQYGWSDGIVKHAYMAGRINAIHQSSHFSDANVWFKYFLDDVQDIYISSIPTLEY